MPLAPFSKPQIAIAAAVLYTAIMGGAMFYMKAFRGITYSEPEMMTVFWIVLIGLNLLNVFWVTRYEEAEPLYQQALAMRKYFPRAVKGKNYQPQMMHQS
jgi:hypothetical protein